MRSKVTARAIRISDGHSAHDSYGRSDLRGRRLSILAEEIGGGASCMTPWQPVDLRTGVMHDAPPPTTTIPLKDREPGHRGSCKTMQNLIHYSVIPDIYTRS